MTNGVPGLILTLLASNLLSLAYGLAIAAKKFKVSVEAKSSLKIYLTSFISATPVLAFLQTSPLNSPLNLIIGGSLFLLTYLTLAPLTGAIAKTDLQNLGLIFSKLGAIWPMVEPVLIYEAKLLSAAERVRRLGEHR